jgi:cytoskeleton protein RodZ
MVIYAISFVTMPSRKAPTVAKADEPAVVVVEPAPVEPANTVATAFAAETPSDAPFVADSVETATTFVAGDSSLPASAPPPAIAPIARAAGPSDTFDAAALFRSASLGPVVAPTPEAGSQTASENVNAGSRIVLTALESTYVRIKDPRQPEGKGIFVDRVLKAGESISAPDRSGLLMQTGNAGGLHVAVDGRSAGVMGKRGEVVTRIPVDPSYFLKRVAASQ